MKRVFADAHFSLALLSRRDQDHTRAVVRYEELVKAEIITTAWVLTEVADGMCTPEQRKMCIPFIDKLRQSRRTRLIEPSAALFWQGFDYYKKRPDKEWSLTDCISFVVMSEAGLTEALTADRHFQQAGFTALLLADG